VKQLQAGQHEDVFNLGDNPAGVYYLSIYQDGKLSGTAKIVKIK
jgi:hypothetical protein